MGTESAKNTGDAPSTSSKQSVWQRLLSYLPEERNIARKSRSVETQSEANKYHPYF